MFNNTFVSIYLLKRHTKSTKHYTRQNGKNMVFVREAISRKGPLRKLKKFLWRSIRTSYTPTFLRGFEFQKLGFVFTLIYSLVLTVILKRVFSRNEPDSCPPLNSSNRLPLRHACSENGWDNLDLSYFTDDNVFFLNNKIIQNLFETTVYSLFWT